MSTVTLVLYLPMKKFLPVIWIAMVVVFGELEARACSCDFVPTKLTVKQQVKKARAESQAVFVGKRNSPKYRRPRRDQLVVDANERDAQFPCSS